MEARNPNSLKHKPQKVPKDFLDLILNSFQEKYADFLKNKRLLVEGAIYPEEIVILIGLQNKEDKVRQVNFEFSIDYENNENVSVLDKIHLGVDALDAMLAEYVEAGGDLLLPNNWTEFDFDNQKIFLKTDTINTEIERQTQAFLLEHGIDENEELANEAPEDLLH